MAPEVAAIASKLLSGTASVLKEVATVAEELPWVGPAIKTLNAIQEVGDTTKRNKEQLAELRERFAYITAGVLFKCKRSSTPIDVQPLATLLEDVDRLLERCRQQGRIKKITERRDVKHEIAELCRRIRDLTGDMGLTGIVTLGEKVERLQHRGDKQHAELVTEIQKGSAQLTTIETLLLPRPAPKRSKVPNGTPACQSSYVPRTRAIEEVCKVLSREGGPWMVGLVGDSGSGKTTTASELARDEGVREGFPDGVLWLPVNKDAKDNLLGLMAKLATMVHEDIMGNVGHELGESEDGAAYIKERMSDRTGEPGLKCLLIADNVWDPEVITKLRGTGMWLLVTTRDEDLMKCPGGTSVVIGKMSKEDALSVLSKSSRIPSGARLPDDIAGQILDLCGNMPMDLAFVGRWGTVHSRYDRLAWSKAVDEIETELETMDTDTSEATNKELRANQRTAILRAGLRHLGAEHEHVQWLYLALSLMPDGYPFSVPEVAVLLFDGKSNTDDEKAATEVVTNLERWSVVRAWGRRYRMHDAHSSFSRGCLRERGDVRRPAVKRWVSHLSSLDRINFHADPEDSHGQWSLWMRWLAVEKVHDDDILVGQLYDKQLSALDILDPARHRKALSAVRWLCLFGGDTEGEYSVVQRLLKLAQTVLPPGHLDVVTALVMLAELAGSLEKKAEAGEWYQKAENTLAVAIRQHEEGGEYEAAIYTKLQHVAWAMQSQQHMDGAERLLVQLLKFQEDKFGEDSIHVCPTLDDLAYSVGALGRTKNAIQFLTRKLTIEESERGKDSAELAHTLTRLGVTLQKVGRVKEAEELLRRNLAIARATCAPDGLGVAESMRFLGTCLLKTGRRQDTHEAETLLNNALAISARFQGPAPPPNFYGEQDTRIKENGKMRRALSAIRFVLAAGGECTSGRWMQYLVCLLVVCVAIALAYYKYI